MLRTNNEMEKFTYNNLSPLIGQSVAIVDNDNNSSELTVASIEAGHAHGDDCEHFSLILNGDAESQFEQGNYSFTHDAFGTISLFMSPNSATEYEIIINCKTEP